MGNPLLDRRAPAELAEAGQVIDKEEQLQTFTRLTELLATDLSSLAPEETPQQWRQAPVAIRLAFGWADSRRRMPVLQGGVVARVPAVCQRCLRPLELTLAPELKLLLAGPGNGLAATDDYEVWEIDESAVRPLDILEEALIMAMPLSALHGPDDDCSPPVKTDPAASVGSVRPFADLGLQFSDSGNGAKTDGKRRK
jgi:uncharacterized metal-binding protein YceD (DUF177 family)